MILLHMRVQLPLLDLISPNRAASVEIIGKLTQADWNALSETTRQHRLAPLLHWRLTHEHSGLSVPDTIKTELSKHFKNAARRSLIIQKELLQCCQLLEKAKISYAALKGAYLAFFAYPHPALRPLRDLDLVVPMDDALHAYQVLLNAGYSQAKQSPGDPAACLALDKHLPPLVSPSGRVFIELHSRLLSPTLGAAARCSSEDWDFWPRLMRHPIGGTDIFFLAPTDLLLHLILHAVYDHQFDNGPLLISDIAYLLRSHTIDWALFWHLAKTGDWTRGCVLALKLAESYYEIPSPPYPDIDFGGQQNIDTQVSLAASLTLRDWQTRKDANLDSAVNAKQTVWQKLGVYSARLFPSRARIAAKYPFKENSALVYLGYLPHWYRLLTRRLPEYLASRQHGRATTEAEQLIALEQWLREGTSAPIL